MKPAARPVPLTRPQQDLCTQNLGLIFATAHRLRDRYLFIRSRLTGGECESEASLGMIRAAKGFDPARETQFSAYAVTCMQNQIFEGAGMAGLVHVPIQEQRTVKRLKPGATPTPKNQDAMRAMRPTEREPDTETGRHGDTEAGNEEVDRALWQLTPQEQAVLRGRFWDEKSLHEISGEQGCSYVQVRKTQRKAFAHLRRLLAG